MSFPDSFSYHFFPVGQGLFTAGVIGRDHGEPPKYLWVYDCGTSSSGGGVANGIATLKAIAGSRERIDLLVLSHFDHDHISGVCELIKEFEIGTLMLPYMPLEQRLIVAFEEKAEREGRPDQNAYLNPVSFFLEIDGPGIEQILLVGPSGPEGPPLSQRQDGQPFWPEEGSPDLRFEPEKTEDDEDVMALIAHSIPQGCQTRVYFLRRGTALTLQALWEFLPYNDDRDEPISRTFTDKVNKARHALLHGSSATQRKSALKRLKAVYDKEFGDDSENRNSISLHLYSGPIYPTWRDAYLTQHCKVSPRWVVESRLRNADFESPERGHQTYGNRKSSIHYTGDGYLDTPERLESLIGFITPQRIASIGVFQVMHHGSQTNWHPGVADAIRPFYSVFSSDPERKRWRHPHAPVLREFWRYGPEQVDRKRALHVFGQLES